LNSYPNQLGEPDVKLAGLKLWIHAYQYRDVDDYWDGNWLSATGICSENGATVQINGSFIRTTEIDDWQRAVEKLRTNLEGEARLACIEPELAVTLTGASLGAVDMKVEIMPDLLTQEHIFKFLIDQSYLDALSSQCARLLQAFPIRGV
jgi:hypothetical protein